MKIWNSLASAIIFNRKKIKLTERTFLSSKQIYLRNKHIHPFCHKKKKILTVYIYMQYENTVTYIQPFSSAPAVW